MNYKLFKEVIDVAERIVLMDASKEEIKTFFINRGINVTNSQVENFFINVRS